MRCMRTSISQETDYLPQEIYSCFILTSLYILGLKNWHYCTAHILYKVKHHTSFWTNSSAILMVKEYSSMQNLLRLCINTLIKKKEYSRPL